MFRKRFVSFLIPVLALVGPATAGCEALVEAGAPTGNAALEAVWSRLPLRFEANQGQHDAGTLFVSRGPDYNLSLTREGASLRFGAAASATAVDLRLVGGSAAPQVAGESPAATQANYFIGRDPSRWRRGVPTYQSVRYSAVYPGIDLVFHGRQGRLEYDFVVAPGADPGQIELAVGGADKLEVDAAGNLVVRAGGQSLIQPRPVIYQEGPEGRREVAGGYAVHENRVEFTIAAYDRSQPLVIDPVFTYASYYGGSADEETFGVARDAQGNVWATGITVSPNLRVSNPLDSSYGGVGDVFVAKFDRQGRMLFSTYLGGQGFDQSWGMALDKAGNAYIVGNTRSPEFPIVGGIQTTLAGDRDGFLVKLNPTGSQILYSTLLGGRDTDWCYAIAIDSKGAIYLAGETESPDFPVRNAAQPTYRGGEDAYVTKLTPDGSAIVYSTFLGGGNHDRAWGIQVDSKGVVHVAGTTSSPNFPRVKAFQNVYGGGGSDAFMTSISADGKRFVYSTFAGGTSTDQGFAVAVDAKGDARYVGGAGNKTFPVRQALQSAYGGGPSDAFVLGLSKTGVLQFSTFIGGSLNDSAFFLGLDAKANIYVVGQTQSSNFPLRNALQTTLGGLRDGFIAKLRSDGKAYAYSTFFGGDAIDEGSCVDVAANGVVTLGGWSDGGFPLVAPDQGTLGGGRDAIVAVLTAKSGPAASCSTEMRQLPSADGRLVDVGLSVQVEGSVGRLEDVELKVFSDDGASEYDVESLEAGTLRLRAETSSPERDRVYVIVATAVDSAGNRGVATCSVVVPRSEAADDVASVFARAAAAENTFERRRALPNGFARLHRGSAGVEQ